MSTHLVGALTVLGLAVLASLPMICMVATAAWLDASRRQAWRLLAVGGAWSAALLVAAFVSGYVNGLVVIVNGGAS